MKPFPLTYPADRPRTRNREAARTTVSLADARNHLFKQLELLGAKPAFTVLSSNAKLRNDGLPYSKQPAVDDPGVAVYFRLPGSTMTYCVSCDLNDTISGNIRAVGLSLAELRAISGRLGIRLSIMLDLFAVKSDDPDPPPEPAKQPVRPKPAPPPAGSWRAVLGVGKVAPWAQVHENYLKLTTRYDPLLNDGKGNKAMHEKIEQAYTAAKKHHGFK